MAATPSDGMQINHFLQCDVLADRLGVNKGQKQLGEPEAIRISGEKYQEYNKA